MQAWRYSNSTQKLSFLTATVLYIPVANPLIVIFHLLYYFQLWFGLMKFVLSPGPDVKLVSANCTPGISEYEKKYFSI